jgi:hypothetical protein
MSQLRYTMTSNPISLDITSTTAIPAIDAKDGTVYVAGRDQTFITNNYIVDPNCNQGIWNNHPATQKFTSRPDKIYRWLSAIIPSTNYHGALEVRLEDTGSWFIDGARFARWKATADDFVWICGSRMYSHHLQTILGSKSLSQLVQARLSSGESSHRYSELIIH